MEVPSPPACTVVGKERKWTQVASGEILSEYKEETSHSEKNWNRLHRKEVESLLLEIFRTWLDRALDNLV